MDMQIEDRLPRAPSGSICVMSVDEQGRALSILRKKNLILYGGADLMARMLGGSGKTIDYLYVEYTNGSVPSDPLAVSQPRGVGIDYYNNISGADYLRIPLTSPPVFTAAPPVGDPTAVYFSNIVTFNGISAGFTRGRFDTPFTNGTSKVYGVALASKYDDVADIAQDLVFSRSYFVAAGQPITKQANQQIACFWSIQFF